MYKENKSSKPRTQAAMRALLSQIQQSIPFNLPVEQICAADCYGCPKKLMLYLENELENWQTKLDDGHDPTLGDIEKLAKSAKKIYRVLQQNKLFAN